MNYFHGKKHTFKCVRVNMYKNRAKPTKKTSGFYPDAFFMQCFHHFADNRFAQSMLLA